MLSYGPGIEPRSSTINMNHQRWFLFLVEGMSLILARMRTARGSSNSQSLAERRNPPIGGEPEASKEIKQTP